MLDKKKNLYRSYIALGIIIYCLFFGYVAYQYITSNRYFDMNTSDVIRATTIDKAIFLNVSIKNRSYYWLQSKDHYFLSYHLKDKDGKDIVFENPRTELNGIAPGGKAAIPVSVTIPSIPGEYLVELDIVKENEYWFKEKGNNVCKVMLIVDK